MKSLFMKHFSGIVLAGAIFAALLAPVTLNAQQAKPWEQIPTPRLHDFKPHQPQRMELKNGIVFFLQEDHELPFVSGSVSIPGGARDVDAAKTGLVSLYGQAWRTSGTAKLSGDALDDLLEAKAAHIETGGDVDSTALSWDSLKGDADQVFALAMDLLFHPQFSAEKLQLAQQLVATEIMRRNDDEGGIASRESAKLVYGANSPYTRQPEFATIGAVTVADLKAWHDGTINGKLIVAISGDFDPAAMEAKLRAAFEGLPAVKAAPPRHDTFAGPKPGVFFIDKEDVNQSNVQIVGLGTDRHNPDVPALAVMNEILGGSFASRLFQKVRTELGLAYAVGGSYGYAYDHPATFHAVVMTKSVSTVDATKAALGEIAGLTTKPFTEEELAGREEVLRGLQRDVLGCFPGAAITLEIKPSYRNMIYKIAEDPKVLDYALEAVVRQGITPIRRAIRGGTDGARLSYMGLPTPNLFAGGQSFHSVQEWVSLEWMAAAVEVCVQLLGVWVEKGGA